MRRRPASDDLTVDQAADALGTSPQTVRRLLREGELQGRRKPWGTRFVWVPSRRGVDEFLSQHGRLDGRRRARLSLLSTIAKITAPAGAMPARATRGRRRQTGPVVFLTFNM